MTRWRLVNGTWATATTTTRPRVALTTSTASRTHGTWAAAMAQMAINGMTASARPAPNPGHASATAARPGGATKTRREGAPRRRRVSRCSTTTPLSSSLPTSALSPFASRARPSTSSWTMPSTTRPHRAWTRARARARIRARARGRLTELPASSVVRTRRVWRVRGSGLPRRIRFSSTIQARTCTHPWRTSPCSPARAPKGEASTPTPFASSTRRWARSSTRWRMQG
mmetsp:Transcript_26032/g.69283  ORF Transcript_26032/g.69283 Transcript_26032/m.69283 type:complete len:227 (+) Transcript_26032:690-1370(+)